MATVGFKGLTWFQQIPWMCSFVRCRLVICSFGFRFHRCLVCKFVAVGVTGCESTAALVNTVTCSFWWQRIVVDWERICEDHWCRCHWFSLALNNDNGMQTSILCHCCYIGLTVESWMVWQCEYFLTLFVLSMFWSNLCKFLLFIARLYKKAVLSQGNRAMLHVFPRPTTLWLIIIIIIIIIIINDNL